MDNIYNLNNKYNTNKTYINIILFLIIKFVYRIKLESLSNGKYGNNVIIKAFAAVINPKF